MKKLVIGLLGCWLATTVSAAELEWLTDLPKAQAKAKAEKKLVLLDFTGSDYCPPCKALTKNVFSTEEFLSYARKNLVLVEVDFPVAKPQTAELKNANQALQNKFKIGGYPTIIILDGDGKELGREVGYSGASPKEFIAWLEKWKRQL